MARKKTVQIKAKIIRNKRVKGDYFHLAVEAPAVARSAAPGQFIMVRAGEGLRPLLRRPFSIHKIGYRDTVIGVRSKTEPHTIEILYAVVGPGTEILSAKKPGEYLDMLGPLGNGFDFGTPHTAHRTPILIAGGMGAAPLLFLAEKLTQRTRSKIRVLIGARTREHILCEKEFIRCGCDVTIATDNGSRGFRGRVTDLFISQLSTVDCRLSTIFACGPKPMLKAVSVIAKDRALAAQLSLEAHMACGIGACLGCVINTRAGYRRVCAEGPVFDALDILW